MAQPKLRNDNRDIKTTVTSIEKPYVSPLQKPKRSHYAILDMKTSDDTLKFWRAISL